MPAENKAAADAEIKETAAALREFAAPHGTRWGGVVDPKDEHTQEFIIVAGWNSIEAHMAFKQHPSTAKWQEFVDLAGVPLGSCTTSGFPEQKWSRKRHDICGRGEMVWFDPGRHFNANRSIHVCFLDL